MLVLYRQSRKIERIWSRSSVPRARQCARRLTTSHEVAKPIADLKAASAIPHQKSRNLDIAGGVNVGNGDLDVGAGDQVCFGHASDERLDVNTSGKELTDVHKNGDLRWLRFR